MKRQQLTVSLTQEDVIAAIAAYAATLESAGQDRIQDPTRGFVGLSDQIGDAGKVGVKVSDRWDKTVWFYFTEFVDEIETGTDDE